MDNDQSESIKSLLDDEYIREKVSNFIQKEIFTPEVPKVDAYSSKSTEDKLLKKKKKFTFSDLSRMLKEKELKNNNEPLFSNVCGFYVNIKELIQNPSIRHQVAPFIEKQVMVPVWSDLSDDDDDDDDDEGDNDDDDDNESEISIIHYDSNKSNAKTTNKQVINLEEPPQIKQEIDIDSTEIILDNDYPFVDNIVTIDDNLMNDYTEINQNQDVNEVIIKTEPETSTDESFVVEKELETNKLVVVQTKEKEKSTLEIKNVNKDKSISIPRIKLGIKTNKEQLFQKTLIENPKTNETNLRHDNSALNQTSIDIESSIISQNALESIIKEETMLPDSSIIEPIKTEETTSLNLQPTLITESSTIDDVKKNNSDTEELPVVFKSETESDKDTMEVNQESSNINENDSTSDEQIIINDQKNKKKSNLNTKYRKKFSENKRMIRKCRGKFSKKCIKCGKKYKRYKMLRNHEMKCNVEVKEYECVMCLYKTKDNNKFKNHLQNHIFGENFDESSSNGQNNTASQVNVKDEKKKVKRLSRRCVTESRCPKCNWYNDEIDETDNNQLTIDKKCHRCTTGYSYRQSDVTFVEDSDENDSPYESIKTACTNKIPYVRLIRLPIACPVSPPSNRSLLSINVFQSSISKKLDFSSTKSPKCIRSNYDDSYGFSPSKYNINKEINIDSDYDYIKLEAECSPSFTTADVYNMEDSKIDYQYNNENSNEIKEDHSSQKRQRTSKTIEWIQLVCQKCDQVQKNVKLGRENKNCEKCKSKVLYECMKCDGKFTTYCTISYHLRYCKTNVAQKSKKSSVLPLVKRSRFCANKSLRCERCNKTYSLQKKFNKHKEKCFKLKDSFNKILFDKPNLIASPHKNIKANGNDLEIPVYQLDDIIPDDDLEELDDVDLDMVDGEISKIVPWYDDDEMIDDSI